MLRIVDVSIASDDVEVGYASLAQAFVGVVYRKLARSWGRSTGGWQKLVLALGPIARIARFANTCAALA